MAKQTTRSKQKLSIVTKNMPEDVYNFLVEQVENYNLTSFITSLVQEYLEKRYLLSDFNFLKTELDELKDQISELKKHVELPKSNSSLNEESWINMEYVPRNQVTTSFIDEPSEVPDF